MPVALLTLGAVYLSDYEEELIDTELASLAVQGEMVAAGISEVAVAGGETTVNRLDADEARQLLTRLVRPTGVRARLFSETGELLGDSAVLSEAGRIHVMPLPPPEEPVAVEPELGERIGDWLARQLSRADRFPEYVDRASPTVRDFPEAASALRGFNASAVRMASDGRLILSAAVPVQRYKQVLGALMLTRDNRAIAASLREVRYDMMVIAAAALGITVLLSLYLAGTITQPIVRLARAADEVRLARESRAGDPRSRQARRRDRRPERRAALDDRRAVATHQHHRELRRRRGARAQEPADLAPLGDRDGGTTRSQRRPSRKADGHRDGRHQPAEPSDLRHLRCLAARCRIDARRGQAGRPERAC